MKILEFIATFVLILAYARSDEEVKSEEGVLVLTSSNFDKTIEANENILVEFYAPWCGHCKALEPQYAEAAKKLAETNPEIKLGKVDATIETTLAERFQIKGFPTMKFFKGGNVIEFTGGRQSDEIVSWLLKKTGPPAKTLASLDEVKEFISEPKVAVIGFFKDLESDLAKNYLQVADSVESIVFAISSDDSVLSEYKVDGGKIIMFKKFDEGEVTYTGSEDPNEIKTFVSTQSLPLAVEFDHQTAQKIFGGDIKTHLLFFVSKKEGHYEKYIDPIKHLAKEIRDKLLFVLINTDEADNQRILEYFGILENEVPSMRLIKLEDEMIKYKPDSNDLSEEHVQAFITAFFDGKLKEHLLSQPLPEDWDKNPVKVLVATNFDEVAFNTEKDVLVEFYAPWCGHCKELEPIYNKLGEKFQDRDDILIAKLDATANELEHTKIGSFPTLKLYKKGDNKVIDYNGERTLEGLTKFLESGGGDGAAPPEDAGDEEDDDLPRKDEL